MAVQLDEHPTVKDLWQTAATMPQRSKNASPLDASTLRQLCVDGGADGVGFVERDPAEIAELCVAAYPTGVVSPGGKFNFSACYTHNYREFNGGFNDWVEKIAKISSVHQNRQKVSGAETVSMWQSLSFGANYKAAYCTAVCPAGEDVIGPFLTDRKQYLQDAVKPLQEADSQTWLHFRRKDANLVWALLRRKVQIHGSPPALARI